METPTDERLVRSALDGDDEAFAELVRRHKGGVLRIAARFARNAAELEDLGQEIFLRSYRDLRAFRGDAPFAHWLSRIAVRACYDALRKRRAGERDVSLEVLPVPLPDPASEADLTPEQARLVLDQAMARLSPEDRLIVTLLELEDRPVREVAALTGWGESRVKVRAFRARKALKRIIGGDDDEQEG